MEIKDYIIAQYKNDTPFLMKVNRIDAGGTVIAGILEKNRRQDHKTVEINRKDVVVNLGKNPPPGKVYNLDVSNLYRSSLEHDWWGTIYFYVKLDKATMKILKNGLDRTAKILDAKGLEGFVEQSDIEIRAKHGKYAGMYKHNPKGRNITWFAPDWCAGNADAMDYVILHEFGHVVRYNGLSNAVKLRQKWLRLYQQSVNPVVLPAKASASIWSKLEAAVDADDEVKFTEALKDIGSEDDKYVTANKIILKWLKQVQHIGPKELSLAWDAGDLEYIKDIWPTTAIDSSKLSPVITDYATVNVEELFAETFAHTFTKKKEVKIPGEHSNLMEKSLLWAIKSGGN